MAEYPFNKNEDPAEFEDVYAGPEMWDDDVTEEGPEPETKNGEAPEQETKEKHGADPNEFACVYAGPEYFEGLNKKKKRAPFEGVYAGPRFMAVYAGPVQTQNLGGFAVQQPQQEKTKKCGSCGADMPLKAKFCGKCGSEFPKIRFCPSCGAEVKDGMRFCTECGTVLNDEV